MWKFYALDRNIQVSKCQHVLLFLQPGVLFLLSAVSGLIVSSLGRPLNSVALGFHKLLSVASVVLAVVCAYGQHKTAGLGGPAVLLLVAAALPVLALFASGALLSFELPGKSLYLTVHRVAPALTAIASTLLVLAQLRERL